MSTSATCGTLVAQEGAEPPPPEDGEEPAPPEDNGLSRLTKIALAGGALAGLIGLAAVAGGEEEERRRRNGGR